MPEREQGPADRRRWWPLVKWPLFIVLMIFIGQRALALWNASPRTSLSVHAGWLVPAAVFYFIGWLPSAWFWNAMLRNLNQKPGRRALIRAYYIGHLGKYVPGKALVLVIRGALLKDAGASPLAGAVTAAYETLVSMAAGAALAVALSPTVIPGTLWERLPAGVQVLRQQPLVVPVIVLIAAILSTPFSAWLFTRIGSKAVPRTDASLVPPRITAGLVLQGLVLTSLGWCCHALSLGCTLQAVSETPLPFQQFPVWLASASLSTVLGFVILVAPGGLGIREWILIEVLKDQPGIGPDRAIVAAGLLRLVWFATEMGAAGLLALVPVGAGRARNSPDSTDQPPSA